MIKAHNLINNLSKHLFWEVDKTAIDPNKHAAYIIRNILLYGLFNDWKILQAHYGLEKIIETATHIKDLNKKTASFLAIISDTPKKNFLCYSTKQSTPKHWNF